jgi:hypothetical protein
MDKPSINGSCLCGTVTFEVNPPFQKMAHCHCSRCRKGTGTGHATNLTVEPSQGRWLSGEEGITRYDLPTAISFSKWFCSHCGCPRPRLTRNGFHCGCSSRLVGYSTAYHSDGSHFLGIESAVELC